MWKQVFTEQDAAYYDSEACRRLLNDGPSGYSRDEYRSTN